MFKKLFNPYRGLPKEVYVIFVSKIIMAVGCFVFPLLTLIMTQKIGLSKQSTGFYIMISGFIYAPAAIIGGKLTDIIGRKMIIVGVGGLSAFLYICCAFIKPSIAMVYLIMVAGALIMMAMPAEDSIIADLTTPDQRTGAYSLTYMGWNIGFSIGPVLGGFLYKNHLPVVFLGDAITTLIGLFLIAIFVRETIGDIKQVKVEEDSENNLEAVEEGSIIKVLFARPILIYFALAAIIYNFVYAQWSYLLPMQLNEIFTNDGAQYYGLIASFNGIVVMVCTPIVTKVFAKTKHLKMIVYGGFMYAVGFGMFGLIKQLPMFFVGCFLFTLGEIILAISCTPFISEHTPASHRGRMNAVLPLIFGIGGTIGPMLTGLYLSGHSISSAWIAIGVFCMIGVILMKCLERFDHNNVENIEVANSAEQYKAVDEIE